MPRQVGVFTVVEAPVEGRGARTVGYQAIIDGAPVLATAQRRQLRSTSLLPDYDLLSPRSDAILDDELARSLAQVRRFYPAMEAATPRGFLVFHSGMMRPGRHVTVHFRDAENPLLPDAVMDIDIVCCTTRREVVEMRFRYRPGLDAARETVSFIAAFPWDAAEAARLVERYPGTARTALPTGDDQ